MITDFSTEFHLQLKQHLKCNTLGCYFLYTTGMQKSCGPEDIAVHAPHIHAVKYNRTAQELE